MIEQRNQNACKPGRPTGQPGFGGRPATRHLLPKSDQKRTTRIYCSPNEEKELRKRLAELRDKATTLS